MIDKVQKIREEVERLKSQLLRCACSSQIAMETYCKEEAYNEVLSMLDTLQEEPVSDECIYNRTLEERQRSCKFCSAACQVRIKEPVSEDLEEAAWLYYDRNRPPMPSELDLHKELIDFFKAGAKWQKSKMVRNAMGGEVKFSDAECRGYRGDFWIESRFLTPYEANEYVGGEKVKLIIIKED